ncbi:allophanate hydrolase [Xylophilus ampelinus]|uniref:Allophanate hydrolase n=1 Tax=Xylophilus ampelinus TaxID=54067 RepID=A0A318SFH8_9BURK|nr:allophanate hydrolase [Xylophilus ampelinus]MCS4510747.1 allophanate hydrolase [Xylophilus ampelinus]PYE76277.1 allophanate hydrolase [Xylophilus ampelinus]
MVHSDFSSFSGPAGSSPAVRPVPADLPAQPAAAWIARFDTDLAGAAAGPLAGLVFAAKDNIDVAGVPTTAACPAFAYTPQTHAALVERLLQAGAALRGKTNLDQFACGLNGTRSPYGAVPNALDGRYVSGGSSSGSAYVVASGQVDFALGTDTAGSGRVPAGLNNIVGLKPSKGLLSARGVLPAAQSVDCVSILARTVAVVVQVLEAAIAHDPQDPYSRALPMARAPLPAAFRFGVPATLEFYGDTLAEAAFADACARLEALGGRRVAIDYAPLAAAAALLYDSALVAERYAAVRDFFDGHADAVIEPVRSILAAGQRYGAADVFDAQHRLQALAAQALPMWERVDLLCLPTAPTHCTVEAMRAAPVARNRELGRYTNFVNLLDYAALSVPACLRPDGLPFGITLVGRAGSDWQLADLGQRFHHASGLPQGATGRPLPAPVPVAALQPTPATHLALAVVGAHLSGLPLNGQLSSRGARLQETTVTTARYRLHALPGTVPPKPGLRRLADGEAGGTAIALEVWQVPLAQVGSFLALVPAPLALGSVELADGRWVHGFVCEGHALQGAEDVSAHGGWRAYVAARAAAVAPIPTAA